MSSSKKNLDEQITKYLQADRHESEQLLALLALIRDQINRLEEKIAAASPVPGQVDVAEIAEKCMDWLVENYLARLDAKVNEIARKMREMGEIMAEFGVETEDRKDG